MNTTRERRNQVDMVVQAAPSERVLELGCGQKRRYPHSLTVDVNPRSRADIIHDLNRFPYPFDTDSFDLVIAEHVLEHLDDVIRVVEEVHRICRPNGRFVIEVPHFSSYQFFTDPTHRHAFSTRSFDYFVAGTDLADFRYSSARFEKLDVGLSGHSRYLERFINRHAAKYEQRFAFLYPAHTVRFDLAAIKDTSG